MTNSITLPLAHARGVVTTQVEKYYHKYQSNWFTMLPGAFTAPSGSSQCGSKQCYIKGMFDFQFPICLYTETI